jgi:hypothetical protein
MKEIFQDAESISVVVTITPKWCLFKKLFQKKKKIVSEKLSDERAETGEQQKSNCSE